MKAYRELVKKYVNKEITREEMAEKFKKTKYWANQTLIRYGVREFWDSGYEYRGNSSLIKEFIKDYKSKKINRHDIAKLVWKKYGKKILPYNLIKPLKLLGVKEIWDLRKRKAPKEYKQKSRYFSLLEDAKASKGYAHMIYSYLRDKWER